MQSLILMIVLGSSIREELIDSEAAVEHNYFSRLWSAADVTDEVASRQRVLSDDDEYSSS